MMKWKLIYLDTKNDILNTYDKMKIMKPDIMSIDTETSGLHIILDKPYCVSFAVFNFQTQEAISYIGLISEEILRLIEFIAQRVKKVLFWNAKFDLHMLYNKNLNLVFYPNITDVMIYARLGTSAKIPKEGGPVLKLKVMAEKHIDKNARNYEKEVNKFKKEILVERNKILKEQNIKIGKLNDYLKDKINLIEDLAQNIKDILLNPKYNPNNYFNIPYNILKIYAGYDAIYTIELYLKFLPICEERKQMEVIKREEQNIPILWKMERYGLAANKTYLQECKNKVRNYIIKRRQELIELVGFNIKASQSKIIKEMFNNNFDMELESTDNDSLQYIINNYGNSTQTRIAKIISELRTLEKWYSTYICKWLDELKYTNKIYTSFNQCGTVSGRFSSDFQQFPKEGLFTSTGEELFIPRRIVTISKNGYNKLALLDFASEELRFQALYSLLIKAPDKNLCRAFIPYLCKTESGLQFDYKDPSILKTFQNYKWYHIEDNKLWNPTDLHDMTTLNAYPGLTKEDKDFKHYRKIAKSINFACNYGAGISTLSSQFGLSTEMATRLFNAYCTTFEGIAAYKQHIKNILYTQNYLTNLFGRRFYDTNYHKGANYLIQGSAADFLKIKLIEINNFLTQNNYKTRMLATIHDEIIFEIYDNEDFIIPQIKAIMENVQNSFIPFIAEVEISTTTWDKKEKSVYE